MSGGGLWYLSGLGLRGSLRFYRGYRCSLLTNEVGRPWLERRRLIRGCHLLLIGRGSWRRRFGSGGGWGGSRSCGFVRRCRGGGGRIRGAWLRRGLRFEFEAAGWAAVGLVLREWGGEGGIGVVYEVEQSRLATKT